jgi:hypothetical protein
MIVRPITRAVSLLAAAFVAGSAIAADEGVASVAQGRDLHIYDDGGVYQTPFNADHITNARKLREFVWTHWTQKRRGYVHIVYRGTDAGTNAYLFIEPHGDRWHIAWRYAHYQALPGAPSYPVVDAPDIVTVERCRGSLVLFDADDQIVRYF